MSANLPNPVTPAHRFWVLLLVGILLARLGWVLLHQPLAGFANQFDMLRTTGCLGLQPHIDAPAGAATAAAPITQYRTGQSRDPSCLPSTEVAFAGLARALDWIGDASGLGDPQLMPLRLVAFTHAFLLLLALFAIDHGLREFPRLRLAHLGSAALVLADPLNTLYLAGFYTEFGALLSGWLALALPLIWLLRGRLPGTSALIVWGVALAALALSRFQHLPLPFLMFGWLAWLGYRRGWELPRLVLPLLLLLPAAGLQLSAQGRSPAIAHANSWNSFFGAALPAAGNADEFVGVLELPPACAQLVHTTWYLRRGRDAPAECPQAFEQSRLRWSLRLATEPGALARLVGRGVALSGQWRPGYLGELAGGQFQRLSVGPVGLGASLSELIAHLPFVALALFWALPLLLCAWLVVRIDSSALAATDSGARPLILPATSASPLVWLLPMLATTVLLGWAASLVGDGYSELARHLHLAGNAAILALGTAVGWLVQWLRNPQERLTLRTRWLLALVLALLLLLGRWVGAQALGFGVLDEPADEIGAGRTEVTGWALDPRGIERIDALFADGTRQALALEPRPEIAGIFGAGIGQHARGFRGFLTLPETGAAFAIVLTPRAGAATVIDRRWMRAPSIED